MVKHIDELLGAFDWQKAWGEIPTMSHQYRYGDDTRLGGISVVFSRDGDAWVGIDPDPDENMTHTLRFREPTTGGGESPRVRQALMILAMAIKADNEDQRQNRGALSSVGMSI